MPVTLSWSAPASDGGSAITGYKIYRSLTTNTETLLASPAGTGTSYVDSTTIAGTTYFYKVSAVNAIGESSLSNEASATPPVSAATQVITRKRFYGPALLGNAASTLYTVPADTIATIRHIHISNPAGFAVDFTFSVGTSAVATRLWDAQPIPAQDVDDHLVEHSLLEGEIIQAFAGYPSTLNLTVDGYELTGGDVPVYPGDNLFPHD